MVDFKIKKQVYDIWKGRCAFCGIQLSIEEHHIIPLSKDNSLANDPNNLVVLCSNHHSLTRKSKDNGEPILSFEDINDLSASKFKNSEKRGCSLNMPGKDVYLIIGMNKFSNCRYLIAVNNKPLIEMVSQKPVHYATSETVLLFIRMFDKENNFIGGMFGDYWASVTNHIWSLEMTENGILVKSDEGVWLSLEVYSGLIMIEGVLYFDGIKIELRRAKILLNDQFGIQNIHFKDNECSLRVYGDKISACYRVNGKLDDEQ